LNYKSGDVREKEIDVGVRRNFPYFNKLSWGGHPQVKIGGCHPQVKIGGCHPQVKTRGRHPQVKIGRGYPQVYTDGRTGVKSK
jgi:hypothetical protein